MTQSSSTSESTMTARKSSSRDRNAVRKSADVSRRSLTKSNGHCLPIDWDERKEPKAFDQKGVEAGFCDARANAIDCDTVWIPLLIYGGCNVVDVYTL